MYTDSHARTHVNAAKITKQGLGLVTKKRERERDLQVRNRLKTESQKFFIIKVRAFLRAPTFGVEKSSEYWPGNISGQGVHFQGLDLTGKQTFPRGHSFRLPSRSRPGTQPLTRSPAHWPSPPFPEPAPRDLPGTGPRGGLALCSFQPLPYLHPAPRPPRVRR